MIGADLVLIKEIVILLIITWILSIITFFDLDTYLTKMGAFSRFLRSHLLWIKFKHLDNSGSDDRYIFSKRYHLDVILPGIHTIALTTASFVTLMVVIAFSDADSMRVAYWMAIGASVGSCLDFFIESVMWIRYYRLRHLFAMRYVLRFVEPQENAISAELNLKFDDEDALKYKLNRVFRLNSVDFAKFKFAIADENLVERLKLADEMLNHRNAREIVNSNSELKEQLRLTYHDLYQAVAKGLKVVDHKQRMQSATEDIKSKQLGQKYAAEFGLLNRKNQA